MLRGGITTIVDDIHFGNILDQELVEAALHAYQDLGIRAEVSAAWSDKPFYECVPHLKDCLPEELKQSPNEPQITVKAVEAFWRSLATAWDGRVRFIFSPSAPHRCTPQLLEMTWTLAESFQRPVLVHVLETRIQALTAHRLYQMPMAKFMHQRGYMTNNTIIAHGVWLSDEELELVAESGASVIHNPACNLKQGSGVAPITTMIRKGVNVGLGTDNNNGNDTNSMFDAMRLATFTGAAGLSDASYPVDSECALHMATRAGARALGRETEIGSIEIGKQADFSLLDLSTSAFFPMNDVTNQFVFCEQGQSVKDVFVAGRHLIQDGHLTHLDEADLMEELAQRMPAMIRKIEGGRPFAERLHPFLVEAYERCVDDPWMKPWVHAHNSLGLPPGSASDGIRKV
jgi:guanine deaminase